MADRIGVCAGCESKFKIPPTFKGLKAKCKKCGGVVEIPPLEEAAPAAAPAPAKKPALGKKAPPAAKKAVAKQEKAPVKKVGKKVARKGAPDKAPKAMSASARARGGRKRTRGAKDGDEGSKNKMWIWIAGGGSLVAIIVILLLITGGDDEESQVLETTANVEETTEPEEEVVAPTEEEVAPAEEPEEVPEEEPIEEPKEPEPIDPVIQFEPFPPLLGCDQDRFDHLSECFRDGVIGEELPVFKRKKLKKEFEAAMEESFDVLPIFLNGLNGLNLLERDDVVSAFTIAEFWNKFTGKGFTDIPVKGDTTEAGMQDNLDWNYKAITSMVNVLWPKKVGDQAAQDDFIRKIGIARERAAEKAAKEED